MIENRQTYPPPATPRPAVPSVLEVRDLSMRYGDTVAVDQVSFSVGHGEIFGILGPNGAGKTTTVECIAGLRRPDHGLIRVLGLDPIRDAVELHQQVGVQLQSSQLPEKTINAGVTACAVVTTAVVAKLAFGVALPRQPAGFVISVALGAVSMLALGTLVAALVPNQRLDGFVGSLLTSPMMFFAGLWVPRGDMSPGLLRISDFTPLGAAAGAVQDSMEGRWPHPIHLLVLAAYAVIFIALAARLFRWER